MSSNCGIPQVSNLKRMESSTNTVNPPAELTARDLEQLVGLPSSVMPPPGSSLAPNSFSTVLPMPTHTRPGFPNSPVDYLNYSGIHSAFKPVPVRSNYGIQGGNIVNVDLDLASQISSFLSLSHSSMMVPTLLQTAANFSIAPFNTFGSPMYQLGNQTPAENLASLFLWLDNLPTTPAHTSAATENTSKTELDTAILNYYQNSMNISKTSAMMFVAPPSQKVFDMVSKICVRRNVPIPTITPLEANLLETDRSVSQLMEADDSTENPEKLEKKKDQATQTPVSTSLAIQSSAIQQADASTETIETLEEKNDQVTQTSDSSSGTIQSSAIQQADASTETIETLEEKNDQVTQNPGSTSASTSPSTSADNQIAPVERRRGPGRPKKISSSTSGDNQKAPVKEKRGRGRPSKARKNH